MVVALLSILGLLTVYFLYYFIVDLIKSRGNWGHGNLLVATVVGAITDFLDTLGIGSFAPTALLFQLTKFFKNDKELPGTLNAGHTVPVVFEAFLFITAVKVEPLTLFSLIGAAVVGSFFGSKFVAKLPEKKVQLVMGVALVLTAVLMLLKQVGLLDALGTDNTATGLAGFKLVIGVVCNFVLGALMTAGVGLYAPCMAMVSLLGMNPQIAFPIMMGSCAGLMPVAGVNFIKSNTYSRKGTLGLTIGGVIGVTIAFKLVKSMDMSTLTWVIIAVVIYTGISYFLKGIKKDQVVA
ncbi:sulfite exporter TauE/SafE family protein [Vagococcus zengguangii]|uniref:Sulfite exporter TauE/SafE family protein n=1 Tax=Vagococcus zengguangii TaxID=2571750 RepID=A0A4D7CQU7_9ENTE|nr:sulfite exporter TauE/SafE family protein [Vagococcus zengguangii]QCI86439.1 sulfite exporter TauE/SafE family protein [Vagococcus zengguangii]TLG81311.1 sulfite exporter TauE/SafE family protein [Vagococcus zengguangii]